MSWLLCVCRHREWARIRRSFEAAATATLQRCRCSTGPQAPRVTVACNYNILQVSQLYCIETAVCFKKGLFNALPLLTVKPICVEYGFQPSNPSVIEHNLSFLSNPTTTTYSVKVRIVFILLFSEVMKCHAVMWCSTLGIRTVYLASDRRLVILIYVRSL